MEKIISSRHFTLDDATKDHIEAELDKLEQEYDKLTSARFVVELQRSWFFSEIELRGKHLQIEAKAKANDLFVSANMVFDKTEKQLRKHLDRVQDHHHQSLGETELQQEESLAEAELQPESLSEA